jgi:tetratricopeptide (TPR) repeat protein
MPIRIESNEQHIKKRIIEIMVLVKKRLHTHGIKLGTGKEELPIEFVSVKSLTLVERIQKRGGDVSSNRFADIFTSRPNRMVSTTIEELVFTYETILDIDMQILSANELLELCHLTRLPIAYISRFASYFSDDEWRAALQFYQLIPMHTQTDNLCIGREALLTQLIECIMAERRKGQSWRSHVVLSGPSGVGKSTLAVAAIREVLLASGLRRIPVVAIGSGFTNMEQVYQAIGLTMRLRLRADEPWYTRLKDADEFRNTIVCLDNLLGNDILPAETMVRHLMHTFPTTQFLITTQIAGLGRQLSTIREFVVTGLDDASTRALYWQIYNQTHLRNQESALPTDILEQTYGYPMHIIALANNGSGQSVALDAMYRRVVTGLGTIPELLLQIMALVQQPLGNQFWALIDEIAPHDKQQPLASHLHLLERRQLIAFRNGDGFVIHDAMRAAVNAVVNPDQTDALIHRVAHQLAQQPTIALLEDERNALQLQIHDVLAIYDILLLVHQRGMDSLAARLIVRWRTTWIRFGLCAQLCVISEATLYRLGDAHTQTSELLYAIGSFYGHRGIVESTMRFLQQAMHHADLGMQRLVWAQAALECALHALQLIGWQESERLLQRAMAVMNALHYEYWVARCHDTLSYVYMTTGNIRDSLAQSDAALLRYEAQAQSLGLADAYSNRGLVFMALGDYVMARQALSKAEWLFQQFNAPNNIAAVHLRIAGVAALENRVSDARFYLTQAFRQIERVGGFNDLLYVIDIGAGVVLAEGDGATALQLSNACSVVRTNMGLSRGAAFDDIVQRQLIHAQVRQTDVSLPPLAPNINELLAVVRRILQVNY